ncbi:MAG: DUF2284 domain-containing protein [Oscillospiraceae bacterium]|nr:DUF2284 domain-containing protein [Oscillospiraceae bacterium]
MTEAEIIGKAEEMGFAHAVFVDTADIRFVPEFRPLCEENTCGKYGANYSCPPSCGTVDEMAERIRSHPRALLLQTMWEVDDPLNEDETKAGKKKHNRLTAALRDELGMPALMVGAGCCDLCSPCAMTAGKPCVFPDKRFSCFSAYCVFVQEMCEKNGMEYDCGTGIVAFFSMLLF